TMSLTLQLRCRCAVLGFIIRKVSGVHYAEMLAERLFKPLGMQTARGIDELAIVPNRAAGYEMRNGTLRNAEWVSPTANSTADGSLY
ncbi:serine hydrolase, partial [Escherichia coli]|uniref:serine hydrolase n=1 Tax=Escherichia coli TaxID=562 RepID=UPI003D078794